MDDTDISAQQCVDEINNIRTAGGTATVALHMCVCMCANAAKVGSIDQSFIRISESLEN